MVRKDEVARTLDTNDEQAHRAFTALIDRKLSTYNGKHPITVPVPKDMSDKMVDRNIREYGPGHGGGGLNRQAREGRRPARRLGQPGALVSTGQKESAMRP